MAKCHTGQQVIKISNKIKMSSETNFFFCIFSESGDKIFKDVKYAPDNKLIVLVSE